MLKKLGNTTNILGDQTNPEVPPGQYVTNKFPVLSFGPTPKIDITEWSFRAFGLVQQEITLDWKQFIGLDKTVISSGFHCVTQWSRLQNTWEGILFTDVMELIALKPDAHFVMFHCYGGYNTNIPIDTLMDPDVMFAYRHDGELLAPEHGGPLRLIVPKLYGWKSAKWVNGMEFLSDNLPGFWEKRGYNMEGNPWKEQRFRDQAL